MILWLLRLLGFRTHRQCGQWVSPSGVGCRVLCPVTETPGMDKVLDIYRQLDFGQPLVVMPANWRLEVAT